MIRIAFCVLVFNALVSQTFATNVTCNSGWIYDCEKRCCGNVGPKNVNYDQRCGCDTEGSDCTMAPASTAPTKCCNKQCYSTDTHDCCSSDLFPNTIYNKYSQKCCPRDGVKEWNQPCTCSSGSTSHCSKDPFGLGQTSCCTRDKFLDEASNPYPLNGTCYNPSVYSCCASSHSNNALIMLDAEYPQLQQKCCKVEGIIAANERCECSLDDHCPNGNTCCYDASRTRSAWRRNAPNIKGISYQGHDDINEYGAADDKCSRNCEHETGQHLCRGFCVNPLFEETCCKDSNGVSDGDIAIKKTTCCSVKPAEFNKNVFNPLFTLTVSYNHLTELCCPRGSTGVPDGSPAGTFDYLVTIPTSCEIQSDRCMCKTDSDCPTGGTCCGDVCTIPQAKEKCCHGFDSEVQEPTIIAENQVCCPLGPYGVSEMTACRCGADNHCPSGRTCCTGANCYANKDRCEWAVFNGADTAQACGGICINPDTDKCCGHKQDDTTPVVCKSKFQKCCGENTQFATCCNKENEKCHKTKPQEGEATYLCSVSLQPSHSIIFHAIVFPIILTFILIAIFVVGAASAFKGGKSITTILTVAFGGLVLLMGLLLLWSMLWKFSVVVVVANAAVLAASRCSPTSWSRKVAAILAFVALLYVVDPFNGHAFLSFHWTPSIATWETTDQTFGKVQNGLQDAAKSNWAWGDVEFDQYHDDQPARCAAYYQWFRYDKHEWDVIKYQNQYDNKYEEHKRYWGICVIGWVHAINIIAGLLVIFQILVSSLGLFVLSCSGHNEVEKHLV